MSTATQDPNFKIRHATVADTALTLTFMKELAEYERLLHEAVATEATLKESLFGEYDDTPRMV